MQYFTLQIQRKYLTTVETVCKNKIGNNRKTKSCKNYKMVTLKEKTPKILANCTFK